MTTGPGRPAPSVNAAGQPSGIWRYGARQLGGRTNGLNLIRLVLAAAVLFAHGFYLAGAGHGPMLNGQNLGGWAVMGFFAISGYLITGSRLSKPLGSYLLLRAARIFPAFIVCLAATAFVFAPFAYFHYHGTLDGFGTTPTPPLAFLLDNAGLKIFAWDVSGTPLGVPYPGAWNGSMWTLYYEFACYLIIAVMLSIRALRRSAWGTGIAMLGSIAGYAGVNRLLPYFGGNGDLTLLLQLMPFFLAGAWLYQLRGRIALTWPVALAALVVGAVPVLLVPRWGPQLSAPFLAYVVLWLGAVIRSPRLIATHDISYGVYIYAWPSQQLLAILGVHHLGLAIYDLAATALTIPFAVASWLLVERPVLTRAHLATGGRRRPVPAAPPTQATPAEPLGSTPSPVPEGTRG